jgi:hypothetical protein
MNTENIFESFIDLGAHNNILNTLFVLTDIV